MLRPVLSEHTGGERKQSQPDAVMQFIPCHSQGLNPADLEYIISHAQACLVMLDGVRSFRVSGPATLPLGRIASSLSMRSFAQY